MRADLTGKFWKPPDFLQQNMTVFDALDLSLCIKLRSRAREESERGKFE